MRISSSLGLGRYAQRRFACIDIQPSSTMMHRTMNTPAAETPGINMSEATTRTDSARLLIDRLFRREHITRVASPAVSSATLRVGYNYGGKRQQQILLNKRHNPVAELSKANASIRAQFALWSHWLFHFWGTVYDVK